MLQIELMYCKTNLRHFSRDHQLNKVSYAGIEKEWLKY